MTNRTLCDTVPPTPGWFWQQVAHDDFQVWGPKKAMRVFRSPAYVESLDGNPPFSFRDYLSMCWWCGGNHINPVEV